MDRRNFLGSVIGNLFAAPLVGWSQIAQGAVPSKAAITSLASLSPNSARDLGPYSNPALEFNTAGLIAASITDYSGIVYDPVGKRMCLFGGGHAEAQETDIRAFDLSTLAWSSLYPPTPVAAMSN